MLNRKMRILGTQFHPEMNISVGNECFDKDRAGFARIGVDVVPIIQSARDDGSWDVLIRYFMYEL